MSIETAIQTTKMSLTTKTVINLMFTSRYIEDLATSKIKLHGLTLQQYNVLRILRGQNGNPANLSDVQERMIDRNSNTTRLIDKLLTKGFVKRQTCPHNRRKVELFITEKGLEILKTLDPITEQNNADILSNLTDSELNILNNNLDKLRNNL